MGDSLTTASRTGTRPLAWAVLAAAVLEVVAPLITINGPGASPGAGSGPDLLITPVGWAFSIWGVIYTLAIVQAVVVLVRGADTTPRRLQVDQVVLYLGATAWILVAALDSSLATAGALTVMLVAAIDGVLVAARQPLGPRSTALLTRATIGLYAGWVTAAFFLNVSTALVDAGAVEADQSVWQVVVLVVAALTLLVVTALTRALLAYVAAGCWALTGILVTALDDGTDAVVLVTVLSGVVLLVAAAAVRLTGLRASTR